MPKMPKTPKAGGPQARAKSGQNNKTQVNQLFSNLQVSARAQAPVHSDVLHRQLDLSGYKDNQAYPGNKYYLVGNSYFYQAKGKQAKGTPAAAKKRSSALQELFAGQSHATKFLKLTSALKHKAFIASLSRFEQYWLSHEPPSSVVGPAYDERGKLVPGSFAVWRLESLHQSRVQHYNYSNPEAAYKQPQTQKKLVTSR